MARRTTPVTSAGHPRGCATGPSKTPGTPLVLALCVAVLAWCLPVRCGAYVPPSEQLIGFMAETLPRFESLVLTQTVLVQAGEAGTSPAEQAPGLTVKERVWLRAPDSFAAEVEAQAPAGAASPRLSDDRTFYRLFMANGAAGVSEVLSRVGVDLESTGLDRSEGVVAYRIGHKTGDRACLLLEKDTFRPLSLRYRCSTGGRAFMVTVRFGDYRSLAEGWFPYAAEFLSEHAPPEHAAVVEADADGAFERTLTRIPLEPPPAAEAAPGEEPPLPEDERLKEVIRALQEKYR